MDQMDLTDNLNSTQHISGNWVRQTSNKPYRGAFWRKPSILKTTQSNHSARTDAFSHLSWLLSLPPFPMVCNHLNSPQLLIHPRALISTKTQPCLRNHFKSWTECLYLSCSNGKPSCANKCIITELASRLGAVASPKARGGSRNCCHSKHGITMVTGHVYVWKIAAR